MATMMAVTIISTGGDRGDAGDACGDCGGDYGDDEIANIRNTLKH